MKFTHQRPGYAMFTIFFIPQAGRLPIDLNIEGRFVGQFAGAKSVVCFDGMNRLSKYSNRHIDLKSVNQHLHINIFANCDGTA